MLHQVQPDDLANVFDVGATEVVPTADGPDQRRVSLDKGIPGPFVAVPGTDYQVTDPWDIVCWVSIVLPRCTRPAADVPATTALPGVMGRRSRGIHRIGLCCALGCLRDHDLVLPRPCGATVSAGEFDNWNRSTLGDTVGDPEASGDQRNPQPLSVTAAMARLGISLICWGVSAFYICLP